MPFNFFTLSINYTQTYYSQYEFYNTNKKALNGYSKITKIALIMAHFVQGVWKNHIRNSTMSKTAGMGTQLQLK